VKATVRLRLAWVNPGPPAPRETTVTAALSLVPPPALPERAVKLDLAIERHLCGQDGLSEQDFLGVFSGRQARSSPR